MENISKSITNGEDPVAEMAPTIEGATIQRGADQVIEALGYDRSTDSRVMHEAEWHDEDDNKHRLKHIVEGDKSWYYLDVYRSLQNDKPFLRYGYATNDKASDMRMYDPEFDGRKKIDNINKSAAEREMIIHMSTSGVFSAEKATTDSDDAKFWDIAVHAISERELIRMAVKRGQDSPVYVKRGRIYDEARNMIEAQEKGLPERVVNRIIDLALESVYPNDLPELPATGTDS